MEEFLHRVCIRVHRLVQELTEAPLPDPWPHSRHWHSSCIIMCQNGLEQLLPA